MLINLPDPYFVRVNSSEPFVRYVACTKSGTMKHNAESVHNQSTLLFCHSTFLLTSADCLQFEWYNLTYAWPRHCANYSGQSREFEDIFGAVQVTKSPPVIVGLDLLVFMRYYNKHSQAKIDTLQTSGGFCVQRHNILELSKHGENVLNCSRVFQTHLGVYFHITLVNDAQQLCFDHNLTQRVCEATKVLKVDKRCSSFLHKNGKNTCSPLFNTTLKGGCAIFLSLFNPTVDVERQSRKKHICESGQNLSTDLLDDLVEDCMFEGDDEQVLRGMFDMTIYHKCEQNFQIPCREGHSRCFNISQICQYKLNSLDYLEPCRTGEHMQNCSEHHCSKMYKCAHFYCIPWEYVCDGKWDCPHGFDEADSCGMFRLCNQLFSCEGSQICVHLENVCDGMLNCPEGDDEEMCDLNEVYCPEKCQCVTYAAYCIRIVLCEWCTKQFLHFHVMYFQEARFSETKLGISHVSIFHVSKSSLAQNDICLWLIHAQHVIHVSLTFDEINVIKSDCFSNTKQIVSIELMDNNIKNIRHHTFYSLSHLNSLNLSNNPILKISKEAFGIVPKLARISLLNVVGTKVSCKLFHQLNIKILETNMTHMCCMLPRNAKCSLVLTWPFSCRTLLKSISLHDSCGGVGFLILSANILTILVQSHESGQRRGAFAFTVLLTSASNLPLSVPLIILWIRNLVFAESFPLFQDNWQGSGTCFVIFSLFLYHIVSSSMSSVFVARARFMVVKYPVETKYKEIDFLRDKGFKMCASALFASAFLTFMTWLLNSLFSDAAKLSTLCHPLYDPSKKVFMIKFLTWFVSIAQVLAVIFVITIYVTLLKTLQQSQESVRDMKKVETTNTVLKSQLLIFTIANIVCWIVPNTVFLTLLFLDHYPEELAFWAQISLGSVNAIVNPCVFILLSMRKMFKSKTSVF